MSAKSCVCGARRHEPRLLCACCARAVRVLCVFAHLPKQSLLHGNAAAVHVLRHHAGAIGQRCFLRGARRCEADATMRFGRQGACTISRRIAAASLSLFSKATRAAFRADCRAGSAKGTSSTAHDAHRVLLQKRRRLPTQHALAELGRMVPGVSDLGNVHDRCWCSHTSHANTARAALRAATHGAGLGPTQRLWLWSKRHNGARLLAADAHGGGQQSSCAAFAGKAGASPPPPSSLVHAWTDTGAHHCTPLTCVILSTVLPLSCAQVPTQRASPPHGSR